MSQRDEYCIGMGVFIVTDTSEETSGTRSGSYGVITAIDEMLIEGFDDLKMHDYEITLEDGSTIHGYECWWIPIREQAEAHETIIRNQQQAIYDLQGLINLLRPAIDQALAEHEARPDDMVDLSFKFTPSGMQALKRAVG